LPWTPAGFEVLILAQDAQQQMLEFDFLGTERARFVASEEDDPARVFCKSLKHVTLPLSRRQSVRTLAALGFLNGYAVG